MAHDKNAPENDFAKNPRAWFTNRRSVRNQRDGMQVDWTGWIISLVPRRPHPIVGPCGTKEMACMWIGQRCIISLVPEHPWLCTPTLPVGRRYQRDETWVEWTGLNLLFGAALSSSNRACRRYQRDGMQVEWTRLHISFVPEHPVGAMLTATGSRTPQGARVVRCGTKDMTQPCLMLPACIISLVARRHAWFDDYTKYKPIVEFDAVPPFQVWGEGM